MIDEFTLDLQRTALDLAPVMVRDFDGQIRLWTTAMQGLYGFTEAQALGRTCHALLATTFPQPLADIENELLKHGRWSGEVVHRRRDHSPIVVATQWSLLRDKSGTVQAVTVCDADITRAKAAEADHWRLASIVEGSHDAIISKTLDGIVTTWNDGATEVFGFSAAEMVGQPVAVLFPPDRVAEEHAILERLGRGERIETYETVRRRRDGEEIHVSLSVSPIRDSAGSVVGASKIARNITEQKLMRARLDELKSELFHVSRLNDMGQMAMAFAHELNQPLAAASNYISGARRLIETGDTPRALYGCAKAAEQLLRTGTVVARLRNFVRKSDGGRQREDIAEVIDEGATLALVGTTGDGIFTQFSFSPDAKAAIIDRVQIQQVVVNLVRNAVQAMTSTPRQELHIVTSQPSPGLLEVSIADTGPGIPAEVRRRLFQPFNTTKENGLGVGLSLCRAIIEDHGGEIRADDNPGGGAVFRFTLPIA